MLIVTPTTLSSEEIAWEGELRPLAAELLAEAEGNEKRLAQIADPQERARQAYEMQRRSFGRWDRFLDTNPAGPHWLRQPEIARIVVESLRL